MALYAFDGTWNVRDQKAEIRNVQSPQWGPDNTPRRDTGETNVHRFREYYGADRAEYIQGVGTRFGWIGSFWGGAFGAGGKYRIRRMYRALAKRYFNNDDREIDIIGFSRGAALAVHFCNILDRHGLRNPNNRKHLAWWYYPELGWTFRHPKRGSDDVPHPTIRFLGLWDCVATFGIPVWPFRNRSKLWFIWKIPSIVQRAFHAIALDEVRTTFALIRPRHVDGGRLYEVWFRGVHSNVGGGYLDRGLSDIALAWMMEMFIWTAGKYGGYLPAFFDEALQLIEPKPKPSQFWIGSRMETLEPNPNGTIGRPPDLRRAAWREIPLDALVHHSVFLREQNLISDYYRGNRQLLRRVPKNTRPVYDPPLFFGGDRQSRASDLAAKAFARIPVRPRPWLMAGQHYVFRSDHWVAVGFREGRAAKLWIHRASRDLFLTIAAEWILRGKPEDPAMLQLPATIPDNAGNTVQVCEAAAWVIPVLKELDLYLPVENL